MADNTVTLIGNITRTPELKVLPNGSENATFSIAVNKRWQNRQTQDWQESTGFFDVVVWRDLAGHVVESLDKGMRVIVVGRLDQRSWETDSGDKRSKIEITADSVGPDLTWATATVTKATIRAGGGAGGQAVSRTGGFAAEPAAVGYSGGFANEEPF